MTEERVDEMVLDVCHACGGTWYDRAELEARLERHVGGRGEAGPTATQGESPTPSGVDTGELKYLACPHCKKPMVRKNFGRSSGVIVDVCGYHGFFLDAGEFERLVRFEEQGGSAKGAQRDREQAAFRARERARDARASRLRNLPDARTYRRSLMRLFE